MRRSVRVVLELEDSEPISGSLESVDGSTRLFSGWLGLMSAVKAETGSVEERSDPDEEVRDPRDGVG